MSVDAILRDGKKLSASELSLAESLAEDDLCYLSEITYMKCVYREDNDFTIVRDSDCPGNIRIVKGQMEYSCPDCGRTVYRDDKTEFTETVVEVNIDGIRDFTRKLCREATNQSTTTKQNGLSYLNWEIEPVLQIDSEAKVQVPILHGIVDEELVEWIRVTDDCVVCLLLGESIPLGNRMEELSIPYRTIGELVEPEQADVVNDLSRVLEETAAMNPYRHLDIRADLSHRHCRSTESLVRMTWLEFEHCIQNLLHYCTETSTLLGGTSPGSGIPDGAFSLHWIGNQCLFMWDAKFVDLAEREETELRDEYDKIFRHVSELRNKPKYQREFGGIEGIVLFSPGIKEKHVVRLAETLHAREIPSSDSWNGYVAYFTLDALMRLYSHVRDDKADVRRKPDAFSQALSSLMTSPSKHGSDEPDEISDSPYNCVHVSSTDINRLFEYLKSQEPERSQFDREAYEEFLEWNHTV